MGYKSASMDVESACNSGWVLWVANWFYPRKGDRRQGINQLAPSKQHQFVKHQLEQSNSKNLIWYAETQLYKQKTWELCV